MLLIFSRLQKVFDTRDLISLLFINFFPDPFVAFSLSLVPISKTEDRVFVLGFP